MVLHYRRAGAFHRPPSVSYVTADSCVSAQYVTGAAQVVDASRVVFAFARDNALPGSRWWKRMNRHTQTPVNAVWLVVVLAGICGVLGFSSAALTSLAGYVAGTRFLKVKLTLSPHRSAVIGLYTSYVTPIFLRITSGRSKFVPGPFSLGKWYMPLGIIAVSWVCFITILLLFPSGSAPVASTMSKSCLHKCRQTTDDML